MKIYQNIEQQSAEWFALRMGRATASNFSKIITAKTGALSKSWPVYASQLIAETIYPDEPKWEGNFHTDRGNDLEPEARAMFADRTGLDVTEIGFILGDDVQTGCSPDGIIYDGDEMLCGLELKCPMAAKHVEYFHNDVLPDAYKQQVHGSMAITGLSSWYFMSYCSRMEPFIVRVWRDEYTDKVEAALAQFVKETAKLRDELTPALVGTEGGVK